MIAFKVFMFVVLMLIPATMIGFGHLWKKKPPNRVNSVYGYRTGRSMRTQRAWNYAHEVCGAFWRKSGKATLIVSLIIGVVLFVPSVSVEIAGTIAGVFVLLQLIPLVAVIPLTETALKKKFGF